MSEPADQPARAATAHDPMLAITISREYGSGGGEIATRLATRLGWRLVDHEVVVEVARRLGVTEVEAARRDEQPEGFIEQLLRSLRAVDPTPLSYLGVADAMVAPGQQDYAAALRDTVLAAAAAGHAVIVGRGSQVILRKRRDVLHVRVVAPLDQRVIYVSRREGLGADAARHRIHDKDLARQRYLMATYERHSPDAHLYDLILNTAVLDLDSCVDLIALALERKGKRLSVSAEELGPGSHVTPYATSPQDLPALVPIEPTGESGATQQPGSNANPDMTSQHRA